MRHDDQHCTLIAMLWSEQPFFVSIHNGALPRHLARARLRHLARREVSVQVRARSLREHEVVRGVAGAHPPFGLDHRRYVEPGVLSWAPGEHCNSHHARHTGQDTLVVPYLRCGSFLYHKSPSSLMRFSPNPPRRRGESLVGVRVHRSFWLCLTPSLCLFPSEYRDCFVFPKSIVIALCFFLVSAVSTGSLLRDTPLQQTRAQSHTHPFLRSLPWSLFCVSLDLCSLLECLNGFRCVTGCHSFHHQVRMACGKPQTFREVDQDPEGGLTRQRNARPSFLITCCV